MRILRLIAIPTMIVAGVILLLLAPDVRAWRSTLREQKLQYEADPGAPILTTANTILPSGVTGALLGVKRDQDWLRALSTFAAASHATSQQKVLGPKSYAILRASQAALTPVTQDPDPVRASQAYNLLAAIQFREAIPGTGIVHGLVDDTLTDLDNALRLDPANEDARENLELVVRYITVALPPDQRQTRGLGKHANLYPKGGYAGPPGEGY